MTENATPRLIKGFTRRQFFGGPRELIVGLLVLFGAPAFMGYSFVQFPTLDPNDRRLLIAALIVFAVSWAVCIAFRKKLMPWGEKHLSLMWGGTAAAAALPMMLSVGAILVVNGMLDQSKPIEARAEIVLSSGGSTFSRSSVCVESSLWPGLRISVPVTELDFERVEIGDSLRLEVRRGALGMQWISKYDVIVQTSPSR